MACSTCPGGKDKEAARINEYVRLQRVAAAVNSIAYTPPPAGQEMIFILYTTGNVAMHNVKSALSPRMKDGRVISSYGRRRGARKDEKELVESLGDKLTVEQAQEYKMLNKCAFFVHPVDIAARPELFKIVDTTYEAQPEEVEETAGADNKDRDFTEFSIKGMTKKIASDLNDNGWVTVGELAIAEPYEIEDSMTETKTLTKLERAEQIIASAKELV